MLTDQRLWHCYREWAIVDADGEALTQKQLPKLATIKPVIDLDQGNLHSPPDCCLCV
jgi:uncharacterized protein YcbX